MNVLKQIANAIDWVALLIVIVGLIVIAMCCLDAVIHEIYDAVIAIFSEKNSMVAIIVLASIGWCAIRWKKLNQSN